MSELVFMDLWVGRLKGFVCFSESSLWEMLLKAAREAGHHWLIAGV